MSLLRLNRLSTSDPFWITLLKGIIERVLSIQPNSSIYIFGSFVADRFTAESDLDLAVIIPDEESPKLFLQKIYESGRLSQWPLDLLVFKKSDFIKRSEIGGVCFDIKESGVELHPNWSLNGSTR
ncbi:MAG: nucleotidyltransferase domain-containing protein [Deltaproteobacteria bacterium]|jgi:predicted nucleotidyltransferase|nr:nucleotidyltransferase domain-containing protein [Deltaproteobacteria bacterium]